MITKIDALLNLRPCAEWVLNGDDLEWLDTKQTQPRESEIQAKIAELQAAEPLRLLRQQRNQLLQQSDWMGVSDRVMTQAQINYRQALRDLPANSTPALDENGQLSGITWPTPPND